MNERTANSVAPRTNAPTRIAFALIAVVAALVHVRAAQTRTAGLLDHDEAISLLDAAGKADRALALYDDQSADPPIARSAASLQAMLRPAGETGCSDVIASLRLHDIHPPLYFLLLHAAQRIGAHSEVSLRLLGSLFLLLSAVILDRFVWPQARIVIRLLAFAILLLSPALIATAIELRQYALLMLGLSVSLAALVRLAQAPAGWRLDATLIALGASLPIWTHFGSLLWLLIWGVMLVWLGWRPSRMRKKAIAVGFAMAVLLVTPAIMLLAAPLAERTTGSPAAAMSTATAFCNVMSNVAAPLVTLPWQWRNSWLAVTPAVCLLGAAAIFVRRRSTLEVALSAMAVVWLAMWISLVATGKLPPHAIRPKYLLAPCLAILAVLVRSCDVNMRRNPMLVATACAWLALLTHLAGLPSQLTPPTDITIVKAIGETETLVVNDPKRGYLFPIVDKLPATAQVLIMRPMRPPADSATWGDPLLVLEIKPAPDVSAADEADGFREFLSSHYEQRAALADGPRRRMTLYRGRRTPAASGID